MGGKGLGVKESGENETSFYQQILVEERLSEICVQFWLILHLLLIEGATLNVF